jgi:transposase
VITDLSRLPDSIDELKELVINQAQKIEVLQGKVDFFNKLFWGKKSEKWTEEDEKQAYLFNEIEDAESSKEDSGIKVKSHRRKKKKRSGKQPLPEWLPRKDIIHDLSENEKTREDGRVAKKIGEVISEKLLVKPAVYYVEKHIRYKYIFVDPTETGPEDTSLIITAPKPPEILEKSIATPELLAYLGVFKFCYHLPFYRIEKLLSASGIHITRASMAIWHMQLYDKLIPILNLIKAKLKKGLVVSIDETTLQVLKEKGRRSDNKSYMWLFNGGVRGHPIFYYHYNPSRASTVVMDILDDYSGIILSDGLDVYKVAARKLKLKLAGCNAHARRKFYYAAKDTKGSSAHEFLKIYRKPYRIEKECRNKELSPEKILEVRQGKSAPLMKEMKELLEKYIISARPSGLFGKALSYTLNEWEYLTLFLQDGNIPIDNNHTENGIRPFVIGRKNWMFSATPKGAHASAALFTLVETAKANKLEPYKYLCYLYNNLPTCIDEEDYEKLLPMNINPEDLN